MIGENTVREKCCAFYKQPGTKWKVGIKPIKPIFQEEQKTYICVIDYYQESIGIIGSAMFRALQLKSSHFMVFMIYLRL